MAVGVVQYMLWLHCRFCGGKSTNVPNGSCALKQACEVMSAG